MLLINRSLRCLNRQQIRFYSSATSSQNESFFYKYGTPLVKCTVIASSTTLAWQLLWQHLEYREYRDEAENTVHQLEERIKALEEQRLK
ncbi:unnamed protein product [Cunninghamella blakesleeana]